MIVSFCGQAIACCTFTWIHSVSAYRTESHFIFFTTGSQCYHLVIIEQEIILYAVFIQKQDVVTGNNMAVSRMPLLFTWIFLTWITSGGASTWINSQGKTGRAKCQCSCYAMQLHTDSIQHLVLLGIISHNIFTSIKTSNDFPYLYHTLQRVENHVNAFSLSIHQKVYRIIWVH